MSESRPLAARSGTDNACIYPWLFARHELAEQGKDPMENLSLQRQIELAEAWLSRHEVEYFTADKIRWVRHWAGAWKTFGFDSREAALAWADEWAAKVTER